MVDIISCRKKACLGQLRSDFESYKFTVDVKIWLQHISRSDALLLSRLLLRGHHLQRFDNFIIRYSSSMACSLSSTSSHQKRINIFKFVLFCNYLIELNKELLNRRNEQALVICCWQLCIQSMFDEALHMLDLLSVQVKCLLVLIKKFLNFILQVTIFLVYQLVQFLVDSTNACEFCLVYFKLLRAFQSLNLFRVSFRALIFLRNGSGWIRLCI